MKKRNPINLIAFSIIACAILSLVAIGVSVAYILGWPYAIGTVGILMWIELNLLGRAYERISPAVSQSGKSADLPQ